MFQGMEYVYEVYKEKSFSKAAGNLFISQPSLSANIKRVETKIGYPVFDRSTKPISLTEPGIKYIQAVERIMEAQNEFIEFVNDWGDLRLGQLVLGGSNLFTSFVLPSLMGQFARKFSKVKLVMVEDGSANLEKLLLDGCVDLVIDYSLAKEEMVEKSLFRTEYLMLAVPKGFQVNEKVKEYQIPPQWIRSGHHKDEEVLPVPLELFKEEPFVLLKPDNDTRKCAVRICQAHGFMPRIVLEADQQMTSYNVACSGLGISFVGDTLVRRMTYDPDVVYYKLPKDLSERGLYFYRKKGRYVSRAMEEFIAITI